MTTNEELESARLTKKVERLKRQMKALYGREGMEKAREAIARQYARCVDEISEFKRKRQERAEHS